MKRKLLSIAPVLLGGCTFIFLGLDRCGDGVVSSTDENCDDQNQAGGDGCSEACAVEPGFECLTPGEACTLIEAICGNQIVESGEGCDDGNIIPGDGCDQLCQTELLPGCGDGQTDVGEQCDDGNGDNTDTCPDGQNGTCQDAFCGDGFLQTGLEQCDDTNNIDGDGCDSTCQLEGVIDCAQDPAALANALSIALSGDTLFVNNGLSCVFTDTITIANTDVTIEGINELVNIDHSIAITGDSKVNFKNTQIITSNSSNTALVFITDDSKVGFVNTVLTNLNSNDRTIRCETNASFVMDRSTVINTEGDIGLQLSGNCQAIIANSLFVENINLRDSIIVESSAKANLVFSTFFNNPLEQGVVEIKNASSTCRIDSIVGENVGTDPIKRDSGSALVDSVASFIEGEDEFGVTNSIPNLDQSFHITNANILGQGNPNPGAGTVALFFDPTTIISGINLFDHDFNNNPRPQNLRDPGAFEEP